MAHILLAEDDASARALMARALTGDGHQVVEAEDGQAALDRFSASPAAIDIVVTDVEMPALDGVDLARRLLAMKPDVRILLISGLADGLAKAGDLTSPMVRAAAKPLSLERLREEVRALAG